MATLANYLLAKPRAEIMADINDFIEEARTFLKSNLILAYLFGSFAREEETRESDIDILVIVKNYDDQLQEKLSYLASDYSIERGILISPILTDESRWERNRYHNTLLYQDVRRDGIQLC